MQLLVGLALLVASAFVFWLALPRDGQVRRFLRNDQVQAYYTVATLALLVVGIINIVLGMVTVIAPL